MKNNKVRPRVEPYTLGYKSDLVSFRPKGKKPEGFEGSKKTSRRKNIKCKKKLFIGKSLFTNFKTLALATVIKHDFFEPEFLALETNISSLFYKK